MKNNMTKVMEKIHKANIVMKVIRKEDIVMKNSAEEIRKEIIDCSLACAIYLFLVWRWILPQ